jgi:hypothetical protein
MPVAGGPKITTTGILLEVDAANASSYTSGSSTWVNVFRPGTRNGTINGTLGFNQDDSKGALTFPGTASSYVDFCNIGDLSVSWSFQVAVKPAPSASGNYTILSYASGSNTGSWTYKLDYSSSNQSAVLSVFSTTGSARIVHQVTGSVPTGSWSIINASYGNTVVGMYVNGQPTDYVVTTGSTAGYNANNRLYLGGTFGVTSSFYTGSMASFFSYNTDVPNTQLVQNYNAYATRFGLPPSILAPVATDPDALRFISIAEITNATQATAINNLVVGLKGAGLWTLLEAIYPLVGGTAFSHKYNLKSPLTYPVLWVGGVTHSSLGVVGNGTGYGNTQFIPTALPQNSIHIGTYSRTSITGGSQHIGGIVRFVGSVFFDGMNWLGDTAYMNMNNDNNSGGPSGITLNSIGSIILNRRDSTTLRGYVQGATADTISAGRTSNGIFSSSLIFAKGTTTYSFAHIGAGLTDEQAILLQNIIQTYQTALGRQV